jgi:hypothetical protein
MSSLLHHPTPIPTSHTYIFCTFYLLSSSSPSSFFSSSSSSFSFLPLHPHRFFFFFLLLLLLLLLHLLTLPVILTTPSYLHPLLHILQQEQRLITYLLPLQQPHARSTGKPRVKGEGPFQPSCDVFVTNLQCISQYCVHIFSILTSSSA